MTAVHNRDRVCTVHACMRPSLFCLRTHPPARPLFPWPPSPWPSCPPARPPALSLAVLPAMEDRYIGVVLALCSTVFNGSSFVLKKKGLMTSEGHGACACAYVCAGDDALTRGRAGALVGGR